VKRFLALLAGGLLLAGLSKAEETPRVVSAGGSITETVYALGAEKALAGVDISSIYPQAATRLPQVGYIRMLSPEGIASLHPGLLLTNTEAGPPSALEQLRGLGIRVVQLDNEHTPAAAQERIRKIAALFHEEAKGESLVHAMQADLEALKNAPWNRPDADKTGRPKVLFIYTRGGSMVNVSGRGTEADAMIRLAGGTNAVTGYEGYKPLTAEAAVAASPDVILVTTSGLKSAGGATELLKQPGLALTPAGKAGRVVALDDLYLLGFGPRLGKAALELGERIHR